MAETNPYTPGVFYSGSFVTQQFVPSFGQLLEDERLAIFVEIEPKAIFDVIPLGRRQPSASVHNNAYDHYYSLNSSGVFQQSSPNPPTNNTLDKNYLTTVPIPYYLIFSDENGDLRYVTVNVTTLALEASGTLSGQFTVAEGHFCGDYLDIIDNTGDSVWRMTVDSGNTISTTLQSTEVKRTQTIRLSHGHPAPIDAAENQWIPAVISLGDIRSSIPQSKGGYAGVSSPTFGELKIQIADDQVAFLANQGWDSRTITVRAGLTTEQIDLYPVIFKAQSLKAEANLDTLTITIRDASILLNRSLQQTAVYTGIGGYEGSASMEGVVIPVAYGKIFHAPAVLIDESINLYQLNSGAIHSIDNIYTGGALLTNLGDLLGLVDLEAWTPTQADVNAGGYRTDLASGVFRLAAPPSAPITVSFTGSTRGPSGTYSMGQLIRSVIEDRIPELDVDLESFTTYASRFPATNGHLYLTSETTIRDALNQLVEPIGAALVITRQNQVRLMALERRDAKAFIQNNSIVESSRSPIRREPPTPSQTYRVGAQKLIALNESDLLSNYSPPERQVLIGPENFVSYSISPNDSQRYDSASNLEHVVNVTLPQQRRKIMYHLTHRDYFFQNLYEFTVMGFLYLFELGDTVLLQIPEMGMTNIKTGIIIGITERAPTSGAEDQTDLLIWSN